MNVRVAQVDVVGGDGHLTVNDDMMRVMDCVMRIMAEEFVNDSSVQRIPESAVMNEAVSVINAMSVMNAVSVINAVSVTNAVSVINAMSVIQSMPIMGFMNAMSVTYAMAMSHVRSVMSVSVRMSVFVSMSVSVIAVGDIVVSVISGFGNVRSEFRLMRIILVFYFFSIWSNVLAINQNHVAIIRFPFDDGRGRK